MLSEWVLELVSSKSIQKESSHPRNNNKKSEPSMKRQVKKNSKVSVLPRVSESSSNRILQSSLQDGMSKTLSASLVRNKCSASIEMSNNAVIADNDANHIIPSLAKKEIFSGTQQVQLLAYNSIDETRNSGTQVLTEDNITSLSRKLTKGVGENVEALQFSGETHGFACIKEEKTAKVVNVEETLPNSNQNTFSNSKNVDEYYGNSEPISDALGITEHIYDFHKSTLPDTKSVKYSSTTSEHNEYSSSIAGESITIGQNALNNPKTIDDFPATTQIKTTGRKEMISGLNRKVNLSVQRSPSVRVVNHDGVSADAKRISENKSSLISREENTYMPSTELISNKTNERDVPDISVQKTLGEERNDSMNRVEQFKTYLESKTNDATPEKIISRVQRKNLTNYDVKLAGSEKTLDIPDKSTKAELNEEKTPHEVKSNTLQMSSFRIEKNREKDSNIYSTGNIPLTYSVNEKKLFHEIQYVENSLPKSKPTSPKQEKANSEPITEHPYKKLDSEKQLHTAEKTDVKIMQKSKHSYLDPELVTEKLEEYIQSQIEIRMEENTAASEIVSKPENAVISRENCTSILDKSVQYKAVIEKPQKVLISQADAANLKLRNNSATFKQLKEEQIKDAFLAEEAPQEDSIIHINENASQSPSVLNLKHIYEMRYNDRPISKLKDKPMERKDIESIIEQTFNGMVKENHSESLNTTVNKVKIHGKVEELIDPQMDNVIKENIVPTDREIESATLSTIEGQQTEIVQVPMQYETSIDTSQDVWSPILEIYSNGRCKDIESENERMRVETSNKETFSVESRINSVDLTSEESNFILKEDTLTPEIKSIITKYSNKENNRTENIIDHVDINTKLLAQERNVNRVQDSNASEKELMKFPEDPDFVLEERNKIVVFNSEINSNNIDVDVENFKENLIVMNLITSDLHSSSQERDEVGVFDSRRSSNDINAGVEKSKVNLIVRNTLQNNGLVLNNSSDLLTHENNKGDVNEPLYAIVQKKKKKFDDKKNLEIEISEGELTSATLGFDLNLLTEEKDAEKDVFKLAEEADPTYESLLAVQNILNNDITTERDSDEVEMLFEQEDDDYNPHSVNSDNDLDCKMKVGLVDLMGLSERIDNATDKKVDIPENIGYIDEVEMLFDDYHVSSVVENVTVNGSNLPEISNSTNENVLKSCENSLFENREYTEDQEMPIVNENQSQAPGNIDKINIKCTQEMNNFKKIEAKKMKEVDTNDNPGYIAEVGMLFQDEDFVPAFRNYGKRSENYIKEKIDLESEITLKKNNGKNDCKNPGRIKESQIILKRHEKKSDFKYSGDIKESEIMLKGFQEDENSKKCAGSNPLMNESRIILKGLKEDPICIEGSDIMLNGLDDVNRCKHPGKESQVILKEFKEDDRVKHSYGVDEVDESGSNDKMDRFYGVPYKYFNEVGGKPDYPGYIEENRIEYLYDKRDYPGYIQEREIKPNDFDKLDSPGYEEEVEMVFEEENLKADHTDRIGKIQMTPDFIVPTNARRTLRQSIAVLEEIKKDGEMRDSDRIKSANSVRKSKNRFSMPGSLMRYFENSSSKTHSMPHMKKKNNKMLKSLREIPDEGIVNKSNALEKNENATKIVKSQKLSLRWRPKSDIFQPSYDATFENFLSGGDNVGDVDLKYEIDEIHNVSKETKVDDTLLPFKPLFGHDDIMDTKSLKKKRRDTWNAESKLNEYFHQGRLKTIKTEINYNESLLY